MGRYGARDVCRVVLATAAGAAQRVDGHVVNALTGVDLGGVAVRLLRAGDDGGDAYSATTDFQGRFRVEGVQDALYTARYMAPKFWPVPNIVSGSPTPFAVTSGGEPVRLEAQMQPIPTLSGRVLDGSGKPVPNATVWLLWESKACKEPWCFPFTKQTKSGAKGEYTLGDPEVPGTWLLSATAPSSWKPPAPRDGEALGWAQTFYPDVADAQLAVRVAVQAGAELGTWM